MSRSGSVSDRSSSIKLWTMRLAAVAGDQPIHHVRVNLQLSFFDERFFHTDLEERIAIARLLLFDLLAKRSPLGGKLRHIGRYMIHDLGNRRSVRHRDRAEERAVGPGEGV